MVKTGVRQTSDLWISLLLSPSFLFFWELLSCIFSLRRPFAYLSTLDMSVVIVYILHSQEKKSIRDDDYEGVYVHLKWRQKVKRGTRGWFDISVTPLLHVSRKKDLLSLYSQVEIQRNISVRPSVQTSVSLSPSKPKENMNLSATSFLVYRQKEEKKGAFCDEASLKRKETEKIAHENQEV